MRAVLRNLLIAFTAAALCCAALQWGGRLLMGHLEHLQDGINARLAPHGIEIDGLRGGWSGLNPRLFAAAARFPAGEARGIEFELDVIESLGRNRLVARRLTIADGMLHVERGAAGWRLRGVRGGGGFDARSLLRHSDQVWVRGRIGIRNGGAGAVAHVEAMLVNEDGQHRFRIDLATRRDCADCILGIAGDIPDRGPAALRIRGDRIALDDAFIDLAGLGALFAGGGAAGAQSSAAPQPRIEAAIDGIWQRDARGSGQARLAVGIAAALPAAPARLELAVRAWGTREAGYAGRFDTLSLAAGGHAVAIEGARLHAHLGADGPQVDAHVPSLSAAAALAPVAAALGAGNPLGMWLDRLAPQGRIDDLAIRIDSHGAAFHGSVSDAGIAGHKGIPRASGGTLSAAGSVGPGARAIRLDFDARDFQLAFPDYIAAAGRHEHGGGTMTFAFAPGYAGMRGLGLRGVKDGSRARGDIALARTGSGEVRLAVDAQVDRMDIAAARGYLPFELDAELRAWLRTRIEAGELWGARLLYQGEVGDRRGSVPDAFEMALAFSDAAVAYHPDWPPLRRFEGDLELAASAVRIAGDAFAYGEVLRGLRVQIPINRNSADAQRARVRLRTGATAARLLDFARETPVRDELPFVSDDWHGAGHVALAADLTIPLDGGELRPGDVRIDFAFEDALFDLADLGLRFDGIGGELRFASPATLESAGLDGALFGRPVRIDVSSRPGAVEFAIAGRAGMADVRRLLGLPADASALRPGPPMATGDFDFAATFAMFPDSPRATELRIESDLAGVAVDLPAPLAKTAQETLRFEALLQFLADRTAVSLTYGDMQGWFHKAYSDAGAGAAAARLLGGAIGIGAPPPMIEAEGGRIALGGRITALDAARIADLLAAEAGGGGGFDWELRRLAIDALRIDATELTGVVLDGRSVGDAVHVDIAADQLDGSVARSGDSPWQVHLRRLHLPQPPETETDGGAAAHGALPAEAIDHLVAADVALDDLRIGGERYGAWRFGVRPAADGARITDLAADLRGLRIESRGDAFWSRAGETRFRGVVAAGNLLDVLPQWDFAASVESESFRAEGELRWPGSPLDFDLARATGRASLTVADGRFLDVAPGAAPILSLVNFSTIAKRMSLDFSDVFGAGVSFEQVLADIDVVDGLARFSRPAEIVGTGASFRVAGTVDLDSGALDNEMIATLPLHSSLPWYAAFLALSNPAGAAAVVVGRQVFKDQLRRLTSGRYRIRGTYEEPEVEFMGIFADDTAVAPAADASARSGADDAESANAGSANAEKEDVPHARRERANP